MSVEASTWVWKFSRARLAGLLVLLRVANNADEYGDNSWQTVPSLARTTKLSERQVTRCCRDLESLGELAVRYNAAPNGAHVFSIPAMGGGDKLSPVTSCPPNGDILSGAIRKERPRTSKIKSKPPLPPFQGGTVQVLTARQLKNLRELMNNYAMIAATATGIPHEPDPQCQKCRGEGQYAPQNRPGVAFVCHCVTSRGQVRTMPVKEQVALACAELILPLEAAYAALRAAGVVLTKGADENVNTAEVLRSTPTAGTVAGL
jgi:hypothetical protein